MTPHSSFFSPSTFAGGEYLYSFFNTVSEKNGFSLKYYSATCELRDLDLGNERDPKQTHKLQSEASLLLGVPNQPDVFEVGQGDLVLVVHSVYRNGGVVQQGNGPELGDAFQDLASLFQKRSVILL